MTAKKVTVQAKLEWRATRSSTSNRWIGICEALGGLSMEAETLDELHSVIPETIHLLMIDILEDNELDQYLQDRGWHAVGMPARPNGDVEFDVPWYLIAEGARGGVFSWRNGMHDHERQWWADFHAHLKDPSLPLPDLEPSTPVSESDPLFQELQISKRLRSARFERDLRDCSGEEQHNVGGLQRLVASD